MIHLAFGVSGFVAAAVAGPRLQRDREKAVPNSLLFVAVGAGILWLGWNGFNGGHPYFAGADASAAVITTNLATAVRSPTRRRTRNQPWRACKRRTGARQRRGPEAGQGAHRVISR